MGVKDVVEAIPSHGILITEALVVHHPQFLPPPPRYLGQVGVLLPRTVRQILLGPDDGEGVRRRACNMIASIPQAVYRYRSPDTGNGLLHEARLLLGASFFSYGDLEHVFRHVYHLVVQFRTHTLGLQGFLQAGDFSLEFGIVFGGGSNLFLHLRLY